MSGGHGRSSVAATVPRKSVIHHSVGELLVMMEKIRLSGGITIRSLTWCPNPELLSGLRIEVNTMLGLSSTFIGKGLYTRKWALQSAGYWDTKPCFGSVLVVIAEISDTAKY